MGTEDRRSAHFEQIIDGLPETVIVLMGRGTCHHLLRGVGNRMGIAMPSLGGGQQP